MTNRRYFITKEATFSPMSVKKQRFSKTIIQTTLASRPLVRGRQRVAMAPKKEPITKKLCE